MISYMRSLVPDVQYSLFSLIRDLVKGLPDELLLPSGNVLSCHHLSKALATMFDLECVDGYFGAVQHSWLRYDPFIIDPYPVGLLDGPIMVSLEYITLPWSRLYRDGKLRVVTTPNFKRDVSIVRLELEAIQASK